MYHVSVHSPSRLGSRAAEQGPETTETPLTRIRLRPKAGFGGQMRGEVKKALHRQSVLLRQVLQRHLRPGADVLDHFGRRERA